MTYFYCLLDDRGVIAIHGSDRISFLQGLVTNDVTKIPNGGAIYAAFLSAQGKYQYDFFIGSSDGFLWIDTNRQNIPEFIKRLSLYKLRADVRITDVSEQYQIYALWNEQQHTIDGTDFYLDPRLRELGRRTIVSNDSTLTFAGGIKCSLQDYQFMLAQYGIPTMRELEKDRSIILENGFDELHAIDWDKGCYLGQELTARTRYRGLVRKRLIPFLANFNDKIDPMSPIIWQSDDGKTADCGEIKSVTISPDGHSQIIMAMARLEYLNAGGSFTIKSQKILPQIPAWLKIPDTQ